LRSIAGIEDADWRQAVQRELLAWYSRSARDLPWRKTTDVYPVWVSEIMLQQTQVATVVPYYKRFLEAFPTVQRLAAASEQEVLRLWEGLGYYRRARQLHEAARRIVENHGGRFPESLKEAVALPGVGRYTAGAVLSIAYGKRLPIVEANTIRLYSRLMLLEGDPTRSAELKRLWQFADALLPESDPGRFNQALMELGSTVCTPREPDCPACPLVDFCPTAARGWQDRIPGRKPKVQYEDSLEAAVLVWQDDYVLLRQCGPDERWSGLWDFPRFTMFSRDPGIIARMVASNTYAATGVRIGKPRHFTTLRHGVTRYRITLECYEAVCKTSPAVLRDGVRWFARDELHALPLSSTGRQLAKMSSATSLGRRRTRSR